MNLAIFDPVKRAVAEVRDVTDAAGDRVDFEARVGSFSGELDIAAKKAKTPAEKDILDGYRRVLECYQASGKIWEVKISIPNLRHNADERAGAYAIKPEPYLGFLEALVHGIPLDLWPIGNTGLNDIVDRYAIPVKQIRGYRVISESSIQTLWRTAEERLAQVNNLTGG